MDITKIVKEHVKILRVVTVKGVEKVVVKI